MNGTIFAQGLMTASSHELRTIYALLIETKLTSLVAVKAKELFKKDVDHFNTLLQKEVKRLEQYSDNELRLKLFLHFIKTLDLQSGDYHLPQTFETKSEEIILHIHGLMLKDKKYEQFVIDAEDVSITQLLVQYQMQQIFSVFDTTLQHLNEAETTAFTTKIEQLLHALPPEQQQLIRQKLQLPDLTNAALQHALLTQGTVVVLSVIVEVSGFTAYTTLTSAIATSAAFTEFAVPFGIYTGAASLLFIVTNPFFLLTLAVGGGGWLLYRQTKKLRQVLLPIGALQLILPVMMNGESEQIDYTPLIKEWQKRMDLQTIYVEKAQAARTEFALQKATIASNNTKIDHNKRKIEELQAQIQQLKTQIGEQLSSLPEQERSDSFNELTAKIEANQTEIEQLQKAITSNKEKTGFLQSITGFFDNNALKSKIVHLESQQRRFIKERLQITIDMAPATLEDVLQQLTQIQLTIEPLEKETLEQQQQKIQIKKQVELLKTTIYELETVIEQQQKEYPGLKDLLHNKKSLTDKQHL